jgi:hypothetical protein
MRSILVRFDNASLAVRTEGVCLGLSRMGELPDRCAAIR